jgi:hypothetical protein
MSIRVRIVLGVVGLGLVALLLPLARVPAGDILVPLESTVCPAKPDASPASPADSCGTAPAILVGSRRIRLNYSISEVGPSGVSSVELWATRDGKTWQRYSNEPPPDGPLVVCVAEEGRYGFSLVVKNGLGLSSPPPRTGDTPQLWVEVDETKPAVRLVDCVVGHGHDAGCLVVTWAASDTNLMERPITISTAVSPEGPWTPVAAGLANTGKYVWQLPRELPYEFYVCVEARDRAGNVGSDHSKTVRVDMARPRGTILGIHADRKPEPPPPAPLPGKEPVFNFIMGFTR